MEEPARQGVWRRSSEAAWVAKAAADGAARDIASSLACPAAIARVVASRGVETAEDAKAFFNPRFEQLHAPHLLLGMDRAVTRILRAIAAQETILIYGDYDVDGTTATVLLKTAIERAGLALDPARPQRVSYHVPHRIREGYGMRSAILGDAAAAGIRLVISVDTGIRAFAAAAEARALGLDLIVTDHHLPDAAIPDALAVVNPNQPGCMYPNKDLCGAAVAFKLAHALLLAAALLTADPAAFAKRVETVLLPSFLKLVAIATIADSVPLTGENRALAALGLAALARPVQPGLRMLMQIAKMPLDRAPTAAEVGFRLAPRINAAGRMDVASDVVELFLTRDGARAQALAEKLDGLNADRRASEARALDAIEAELPALLTPDGAYPADCIVLDHPDWHRGVLGILASRVVDRTGRPALVLTHADGDAYGSGRSIPGFHLLEALTAVNSPAAEPLFHRFGGHAHAVGFSLASGRVAELRARMSAHAGERLTEPLLIPQREYDAELLLANVDGRLLQWIGRLAPFGQQNAEPVFLTRGASLAAPVRTIKEKHVCLSLTQSGPGGRTISALGWSRGAADWPARCAQLRLQQDAAVDLLYRVKENTSREFGGIELELYALRAAET